MKTQKPMYQFERGSLSKLQRNEITGNEYYVQVFTAVYAKNLEESVALYKRSCIGDYDSYINNDYLDDKY